MFMGVGIDFPEVIIESALAREREWLSWLTSYDGIEIGAVLYNPVTREPIDWDTDMDAEHEAAKVACADRIARLEALLGE